MLEPITFRYTNHRYETRERKVTPTSLDFISNPGFDYEPGWFLTGFCHDKQASRSFRLSHIHISLEEEQRVFRLPLVDIWNRLWTCSL